MADLLVEFELLGETGRHNFYFSVSYVYFYFIFDRGDLLVAFVLLDKEGSHTFFFLCSYVYFYEDILFFIIFYF